MAESAVQVAYRQEHVASFERRQSLLRGMCTQESEVKGRDAIFLVAGSGGATATTRGVNGKIPGRGNDLTQNTCTLVEYHDVVDMTGFNIYTSQGDQMRIAQESTMAVINRRMDASVIAAVEAGTQYAGVAAAALTLDKVAHILAILGNANAGGANVSGAISPAAYVDLLQTEEFTNVNYVDKKVFAATNDAIQARFAWAGIEWVVHSGLTGAATSTEKCLFWNKAAVGLGVDKGDGSKVEIGRDGRNDISWTRASVFIGAKLLQNTGVVIFRHAGDGYAATA
jgi:hypothetical protein